MLNHWSRSAFATYDVNTHLGQTDAKPGENNHQQYPISVIVVFEIILIRWDSFGYYFRWFVLYFVDVGDNVAICSDTEFPYL